MQTLEQIDAEIEKVLNANTSSEWLKWALRSGMTRDPIGIANDTEMLMTIFAHRLKTVLHESGTPPPVVT